MAYLKKTEITLVREINKEFSDLLTSDPFDTDVFRKMMTALAPIIRETNHNTTIAVSENEVLSPELKANIEGLRSLFKYYKLVQLSLEDFNNF